MAFTDLHDNPAADPPPLEPVPTIGALMREGMGNWVWAYCARPGCGYSRAIALAPFAIRWA
jgi:hypothetical protein